MVAKYLSKSKMEAKRWYLKTLPKAPWVAGDIMAGGKRPGTRRRAKRCVKISPHASRNSRAAVGKLRLDGFRDIGIIGFCNILAENICRIIVIQSMPMNINVIFLKFTDSNSRKPRQGTLRMSVWPPVFASIAISASSKMSERVDNSKRVIAACTIIVKSACRYQKQSEISWNGGSPQNIIALW